MNTQNIIILAIVIIVGIILLKVIARVFIKVLIFIAVAGAILYLLFFFRGGIVNKGEKRFILYEIQSKYCGEKQDTIKCECIINPLLVDLSAKYSKEEIAEISKNPLKTAETLLKLLNDNKKAIKACLKEKDADYAWDDFVNDLKSLKLVDKLKDVFNAVRIN
jgi:hypothetical protein